MIGIMYFTGTARIFTRCGMMDMAIISATMLATNREAMRPQANCGLLVNSSGPGFRPHIIRPPSSTAPVPEPGMPSASSGAKEPAAAALLADSQAATPSMAPVPRGSLLLKPFCMA